MQVYTYLYIYIVPDGISLQQLALQIKKKKTSGGGNPIQTLKWTKQQ